MAFESRQVSEKMVWAWVQHHTVFKRSHKSTMIHWQTWDFQHSDSDQAQFFSSALACSHGSQSKTLKGGALPSYWSMFTPCYLSPVHLPVISDKIHLILRTEPQALHGDPAFLGTTRHVLVIIRCILCCYRWSLSRSLIKAFSETDCITRTSEKDFKASFFSSKAGDSNCPKSTI